jgi:hypothetical protein
MLMHGQRGLPTFLSELTVNRWWRRSARGEKPRSTRLFLEQKMDPLRLALLSGSTLFISDHRALTLKIVIHQIEQLRAQGWRVLTRPIRRPQEGAGVIAWLD